MKQAIKIIESSFENQILDKQSKKQLKHILSENKAQADDLNFLSKSAFDLLKKSTELNTFLIDWLEDIENVINSFRVQELEEAHVCFSPKNECSAKICEFISQAKQSLLICVFTISDNLISDSILASYKRGVKVKIITDNDKSFDKGSDIHRLASEGVEIKIDMSRHHMHHKFAIRDNKSLLSGSYNWTRSAEIYNQENFIITDNSKLVKSFRKEFDKLWMEMADYQKGR